MFYALYEDSKNKIKPKGWCFKNNIKTKKFNAPIKIAHDKGSKKDLNSDKDSNNLNYDGNEENKSDM